MKCVENEIIVDIPRERNGKQYWIVLLKDLGHLALYLNMSDGYKSGFEVHKIRTKKAETKNINEKIVDMKTRNVIASSGEFGYWAWAYLKRMQVYEHHPEFEQYDRIIRIRTGRALGDARESTEACEGL